MGPKEAGRGKKVSFPLWFPSSAPLTYKDGTSLALSCIADYGAPIFPFLAVGGYQGKLGRPWEAKGEAIVIDVSSAWVPGLRRLQRMLLPPLCHSGLLMLLGSSGFVPLAGRGNWRMG